MQLATAHISKQLPQGATVVEWGNQRFRYSEGWLDECEKISGRVHRRPTLTMCGNTLKI
jgi:hypothetical protein